MILKKNAFHSTLVYTKDCRKCRLKVFVTYISLVLDTCISAKEFFEGYHC